MLKRLALRAPFDQIAQRHQFRVVKRALEFEIKIHSCPPERVSEQMLSIQPRIVDLVPGEIRGRRLQYFQETFRCCHVERSRDISRYFRNSHRFLHFGRNDRKRMLTPKSTTLSIAPPRRQSGATESSRGGAHYSHT